MTRKVLIRRKQKYQQVNHPAGSTEGVSGKLDRTPSSVFSHIHNLSKSILNCGTVSYVTKILQNF